MLGLHLCMVPACKSHLMGELGSWGRGLWNGLYVGVASENHEVIGWIKTLDTNLTCYNPSHTLLQARSTMEHFLFHPNVVKLGFPFYPLPLFKIKKAFLSILALIEGTTPVATC